jgi:hypothetical protein
MNWLHAVCSRSCCLKSTKQLPPPTLGAVFQGHELTGVKAFSVKEPDRPIVITKRPWQVRSRRLSLSSQMGRNFDILNLGLIEVDLGQ